MTIVFNSPELVPENWRAGMRDAALRVFNPGLLRDGTGWLLAYRVVTDPGLRRRLAICRLDRRFGIVAGSIVPLTDQIRFPRPQDHAPEGTSWFADPRMYRLAGRVFIYWNSGWHEPQNCQFLQELDPQSLAPIGAPRELVLEGARQKLEKNWTLFESDGGIYAVYSVNPHRVLRCSLAGREGPINCTDAWPPIPHAGGFAQLHGGLRGGTPPQKLGDHFWSFCHSIENGTGGYRYVASAYRFAAEAPFRPTDLPHSPLALHVPATARRLLPKLNPAVSDVVYPAGAAYVDGKWVISFGIDDERSAVTFLDADQVTSTLAPLG